MEINQLEQFDQQLFGRCSFLVNREGNRSQRHVDFVIIF